MLPSQSLMHPGESPGERKKKKKGSNNPTYPVLGSSLRFLHCQLTGEFLRPLLVSAMQELMSFLACLTGLCNSQVLCYKKLRYYGKENSLCHLISVHLFNIPQTGMSYFLPGQVRKKVERNDLIFKSFEYPSF